MKGLHHITISNAKVKYDFDIKRNITIIRGDSATGKTTLVQMIDEVYESGADSGITLNCDKQCRVLSGRDWSTILPTITDSIVFIDEDNDFLTSTDFAEAIKASDNYYVIVTREGLPTLPYSVEEIYGIRTSGKYAGLTQTYHEFFHIYGDHSLKQKIVPDTIIVEDSNSGYEFFNSLSLDKQYKVLSAYGKSNVFAKTAEKTEGTTVIIADGAAFGSEMDRMMKLVANRKNIFLYLPESFEWLVLASDVLQSTEVKEILNNPEEFVESSEFFSWERFFTHLLVEKTKDSFLKYSKKKLNDAYLNETVSSKIKKTVTEIEL